MSCSSSTANANTTHGLPLNGSSQPASLDPRMTIRNPSGPGVSAPRYASAQPYCPFRIMTDVHTCDFGQSANYARPSSSITRSEESTYAPTTHFVDIGTPNYAPAPNHSRVVFSARGDADPAPPSRGIPIPSFFEESHMQLIEAAEDTPLASTPAGEENTIVLEFHVRID